MMRLRGLSWPHVRKGNVERYAVGGWCVPAGTIVGTDMVGVSQAAQRQTIGVLCAFDGLDDDRAAPVFGSVNVVPRDVARGTSPCEPYLSAHDLGCQSGTVGTPIGTGAAGVLAGRLDHALRPEKARDQFEI